MRDSATWANVIMTNMERPLSGYDSMNGGAINRVLDVEMMPGDMFSDGNATVRAITRNYGHLGELFVRKVIECYDQIQGLVDGFEDKIKAVAAEQGHDKEQKQIMPMALILTADELLGQMLGDDIRLDLNWCVDCLKNVDEVSEMDRAWNSFLDEVTMNTGKFNPICDMENNWKYPAGCWGLEKNDEISIVPAALDIIAKQHNFSTRQFLSWAKKEGHLEAGDGRNLTKKVKFPGSDKSARCYVFLKPDPDSSEPTEDKPEVNLPPVFANNQNKSQCNDKLYEQLDIKF